MDGDVHTLFRIDRWYNEIEGSSGLVNRSAVSKPSAVAVGKRLAQGRGVRHVIHLRNGAVERVVVYPRTRGQVVPRSAASTPSIPRSASSST